ncbi:MAG: cytochrome c [Cocleimonas sp.]|nr:cytochrome c [Cocleimonas sp.]
MKINLSFLTILLFALTACGEAETTAKKSVATTDAPNVQIKTMPSGPSNTAEVMRGRGVFKEHCQVCHGEKAIGQVANWREPLADGKYPAPPLDGTGHAWHHPEATLLQTINKGGMAIGGTMPAFKDKLSAKDKRAVLSYIESLWPTKTYQMWLQRNKGH